MLSEAGVTIVSNKVCSAVDSCTGYNSNDIRVAVDDICKKQQINMHNTQQINSIHANKHYCSVYTHTVCILRLLTDNELSPLAN